MGSRPTRSRLFRGGGDQRGASAVEFALISLPLLTLMLGMLQYGWYFFSAQSASSGARESARRLVVGDCTGSGQALQFARRQANQSTLTLTWGTPGATATTVSTPGTLPAVGQTLRVVVTVDGGIIGFVPVPGNGQITRVVDARVEDDVAGATCP